MSERDNLVLHGPHLERAVTDAGMEWRNRPPMATERVRARMQFQLMVSVIRAGRRDGLDVSGTVAWRLVRIAAGEIEV